MGVEVACVIVPATTPIEAVLNAYRVAAAGAGLEELWVEVATDLAIPGDGGVVHRFTGWTTAARRGDLGAADVARPLSRSLGVPVLAVAWSSAGAIASYEIASGGEAGAREAVAADGTNDAAYAGTIARGIARWLGSESGPAAVDVDWLLDGEIACHHVIAAGAPRTDRVVRDDRDLPAELGRCFAIVGDPLAWAVLDPLRLAPIVEAWLDELRVDGAACELVANVGDYTLDVDARIERTRSGARLHVSGTILRVCWNPTDASGARTIAGVIAQSTLLAAVPVELGADRVEAVAGAREPAGALAALRDWLRARTPEIKARLALDQARSSTPSALIWGSTDA